MKTQPEERDRLAKETFEQWFTGKKEEKEHQYMAFCAGLHHGAYHHNFYS